MESYHWSMLYAVAMLFDFLGWLLIVTGIGGTILSIFAGLTFITWAISWRSKGIGNAKFFTALLLSFGVEAIPIVGSILPTWMFLIYRSKKTYERGSSVLAPVMGSTGATDLKSKIKGKILPTKKA